MPYAVIRFTPPVNLFDGQEEGALFSGSAWAYDVRVALGLGGAADVAGATPLLDYSTLFVHPVRAGHAVADFCGKTACTIAPGKLTLHLGDIPYAFVWFAVLLLVGTFGRGLCLLRFTLLSWFLNAL